MIRAFGDFCKPQDATFIARHKPFKMKQNGVFIEEIETKIRKHVGYVTLTR